MWYKNEDLYKILPPIWYFRSIVPESLKIIGIKSNPINKRLDDKRYQEKITDYFTLNEIYSKIKIKNIFKIIAIISNINQE